MTMKTTLLIPTLLIPICTVLLAVPGLAVAATVHVPADQPTIQAGIDAASAGDTVLVAPGTYSGAGNRNLDFGGVDMVVQSEGGPAVTIIDCDFDLDGNGRGFIFENGETAASKVEGFTIRDCFAPSHPTYANSGGGMLIVNSSPTVDFVTFQENGANGGSGGGIACISCMSDIVDSDFIGNYTNNYGSAIYCVNAAPDIITCNIDGNNGNGAIATDNADPFIESCWIRGNQGIDSRGGAGLRFDTTSDPYVEQCLITGNKANGVARGGGGVYLAETATAYFLRCTIAGNSSPDVGGGILYASGSAANATLERCILWGNCAGSGGDQVYLDAASGSFQTTCSIIDSSGVEFAGASFDADTIYDNPLFCDPWDCSLAPSTLGDYTVAMNSPALSANNSCGINLGPLGMGCGDITPARPTTWGKLKTLYGEH